MHKLMKNTLLTLVLTYITYIYNSKHTHDDKKLLPLMLHSDEWLFGFPMCWTRLLDCQWCYDKFCWVTHLKDDQWLQQNNDIQIHLFRLKKIAKFESFRLTLYFLIWRCLISWVFSFHLSGKHLKIVCIHIPYIKIYRLLKKQLLQPLQNREKKSATSLPPAWAPAAAAAPASAPAPRIESKTELEKKDNPPPVAKAPVMLF